MIHFYLYHGQLLGLSRHSSSSAVLSSGLNLDWPGHVGSATNGPGTGEISKQSLATCNVSAREANEDSPNRLVHSEIHFAQFRKQHTRILQTKPHKPNQSPTNVSHDISQSGSLKSGIQSAKFGQTTAGILKRKQMETTN